MPAVLIIDESLDKRLAADLRKRGRPAKAHGEIGFTSLKDPQVFPMLAAIVEPWVLVTGDDFMPAEHKADLRAIAATVATIDGEWERLCSAHNAQLECEQFKQETVHRWAHSMADQQPGTFRRYNPWRNDAWTLRKQHVRRLAVQSDGTASEPELDTAGGQAEGKLFRQ